MNCLNHPDTPVLSICTGCAEGFCGNCLVEIRGEKYCGSCKVITVKTPPPRTGGGTDCQEANDALRYAVIGIFCFGIILEPIALMKATSARRRIAANPELSGSGKVMATYAIAGLVLIFWLFAILMRTSS